MNKERCRLPVCNQLGIRDTARACDLDNTQLELKECLMSLCDCWSEQPSTLFGSSYYLLKMVESGILSHVLRVQ